MYPYTSGRQAAEGVTPTLSVVVLTTGDSARLRTWLAGVSRACQPLAAEIVVTGPSGGLEEEFRAVSFVAAPAVDDPAALRRAGMKRAGGDIVLFTDDAATDLPERLALLADVCGPPWAAVGSPG
jgi:hypothetical protein